MSILNLCVESLESLDTIDLVGTESSEEDVGVASRPRGMTVPARPKEKRSSKKKAPKEKKSSAEAPSTRVRGNSSDKSSKHKSKRDKGEKHRTKFKETGRSQNLSDPHVSHRTVSKKKTNESHSSITSKPLIHAFSGSDSYSSEDDGDDDGGAAQKSRSRKHKHSKSVSKHNALNRLPLIVDDSLSTRSSSTHSSKSPRKHSKRGNRSKDMARSPRSRSDDSASKKKSLSIGRSHLHSKERPGLDFKDVLENRLSNKGTISDMMKERREDDDVPRPLLPPPVVPAQQLPPLMIPSGASGGGGVKSAPPTSTASRKTSTSSSTSTTSTGGGGAAGATPKLPPPLIGPGSKQGAASYQPPKGGVPLFGWGTTIVPRQVTAPEAPPAAPPFVAVDSTQETATVAGSGGFADESSPDGTSTLDLADLSSSAASESSDKGDIAFEEMMIDGRLCNVIVTGPITKLIDVMAAREIPDQHYIDAFILTHTYFMKSAVLIDKLSDVFSRVPDDSASEAEKEEHRKWQKAIRGRVVNVILRWIERKFEDMATYPELITQVLNFITQKVLEDPSDRMMTVLATKLGKAIHRQRIEYHITLSDLDTLRLQQCSGVVATELSSPTSSFSPGAGGSARSERAATIRTGTNHHPGLLVPSVSAPIHHDAPAISTSHSFADGKGKTGKSRRVKYKTTRKNNKGSQAVTSMLDLKPSELAQQLTMLEQTMFRSVFPSEILCGNWKRENKEDLSPNVLQLIRWFNHITLWVATECVQPEKPKHRAKVIALFIQAALELRSMQNYNSCIEIVMGLQTPSVKCMKKVWALVEKTYPTELENFRDIERITNYEGNYKDYRVEFKAKLPPRLPYLAVHLGDLLTMEELPTYIKATKHINYKKMRLIYEAAQPLLVKNDLDYTFPLVPHIQKYFTEDMYVMDEKESYKRAKSLENAK